MVPDADPAAPCPVCGSPSRARRQGRACARPGCGHAWNAAGPQGARVPLATLAPTAPIGARSRAYRALQRRLGVLARREALDALLLEEGHGRAALAVARAPALAQRLRGQGWKVQEAQPSVAAVRQGGGPYDAVAIAGLAEAADPVGLLRAATSMLAPRGRLVAAVDNRRGLLGRNVPPPPGHHFTPASLRTAATAAGLARVLVFTTSCGAGPARARARAPAVVRPIITALDPLWVAATVLHPDIGEEVVLWAMR